MVTDQRPLRRVPRSSVPVPTTCPVCGRLVNPRSPCHSLLTMPAPRERPMFGGDEVR